MLTLMRLVIHGTDLPGRVCATGEYRNVRRAKITLDPANSVLREAALSGDSVAVHLGLTDAKGNPLCARVPDAKLAWTTLPG